MLLCDYLQICCDRKVVPSLTWLNKSRRSLRRPWARHLLSASCSRGSVTDRSIHRWTRRLQEARTTPSVLPCWKMLWMCPVGWCNMSPLYTTYIFPLTYMWCPFTYSTPDPQASCVCRCIRRWMCWASSRCGRAERSHTPQFWEIHSLSARETTTDKLDRISEILLLQTDF